MDEEIEAPEEALEAMVEDEEGDLGDGLTMKCPKNDGGGGTILVAS